MKNLKKILSVLLCVVIVLSLVACGGGDSGSTSSGSSSTSSSSTSSSSTSSSDTAEIEPIHVIVSSGLPITHVMQPLYDGIMEAVARDTNGAVTYDMFTGGELVTLNGELDALRDGTIDVACSLLPPYDAARFPLTEVCMLPILDGTLAIFTEAYQLMLESDVVLADGKTFKELEYTDNGLEVFVCPATDPYTISFTEKEMTSPADFTTALRMRSPSHATDMMANNLGVTPVTMTIADAYDAMSRGALDGVILNADWVQVGIHELLAHVYMLNMGTFPSLMAISTDTWNSWPQEVRDAWNNNYDACLQENVAYRQEFVNGQIAGVQEAGATVHYYDDLNDELKNYIDEAFANTWSEWIEGMEAQGKPGKAVAILWRDCLLEAGGDVIQAVKDLA